MSICSLQLQCDVNAEGLDADAPCEADPLSWGLEGHKRDALRSNLRCWIRVVQYDNVRFDFRCFPARLCIMLKRKNPWVSRILSRIWQYIPDLEKVKAFVLSANVTTTQFWPYIGWFSRFITSLVDFDPQSVDPMMAKVCFAQVCWTSF
jgi:hypothetical protein